MVRSAIFSWALVLLLAGLGGHALQFPVFAQAAIDIGIYACVAGVLVHVIRQGIGLLWQDRRTVL
jgi:hypothetical protein